MRCSRIKTATQCDLVFFGVAACLTGSRICNEEATGSIPVSSTLLRIPSQKLDYCIVVISLSTTRRDRANPGGVIWLPGIDGNVRFGPLSRGWSGRRC